MAGVSGLAGRRNVRPDRMFDIGLGVGLALGIYGTDGRCGTERVGIRRGLRFLSRGHNVGLGIRLGLGSSTERVRGVLAFVRGRGRGLRGFLGRGVHGQLGCLACVGSLRLFRCRPRLRFVGCGSALIFTGLLACRRLGGRLIVGDALPVLGWELSVTGG